MVTNQEETVVELGQKTFDPTINNDWSSIQPATTVMTAKPTTTAATATTTTAATTLPPTMMPYFHNCTETDGKNVCRFANDSTVDITAICRLVSL